MAAASDGWKMLLYLVPILGLILLAVRGLKSVYQRTGAVPGVLAPRRNRTGRNLSESILAGFNLVTARSTGGSNIRVVESVPLGAISLHLVEVCGKRLLLGSGASGVSTLASLDSEDAGEGAEFSSLLTQAQLEIGGDTEAQFAAVLGSLDESVRGARETVTGSAARLRSLSGNGR